MGVLDPINRGIQLKRHVVRQPHSEGEEIMKHEKNEVNVELEGYPYNSITELLESMEEGIMEEEKRAWVNDFYRAVGYALFLAKQENDTSLRQGYILLDNAVEQFLKSYLRIIKDVNFEKDKVHLDKLIKIAKKNIENSSDILDRVIECHNTRNNLYHSPVYLSISKSSFSDYLSDVFSLGKLTGFANISDIVSEEFDKIIQKMFDKMDEERSNSLRQIGDLLKDNFGITPGIYQGDILLGSASGDSNSAFDGIKTLLFGIFGREEVNGKKARVLEVIESNEENPFHSFFISYVGSSTWYCFYNCFWSKWGEGEGYWIQRVREVIKQNEDKIDYKIDYIGKGYFQGAFDPFFTGERI